MNEPKKPNGPSIPLLFFAFAFFTVLLGLFSKYSFQVSGIGQALLLGKRITAPTKTPPHKLMTTTDFSRTVLCADEASASALLQGTQATAQSGNEHYLLDGDCLYYWQSGQKTGNKMCGVGQYLTIGRTLLSTGLLTNESAGEMVKNMGKDIIPSSFDFQKMLSTCKNIKEVKPEMFALPQGVLFK